MEISQEILPDEITLIPAPDPATNNTPPAISEDPVIQTNEGENSIYVTTKAKDESIPKNISHAFKCDESEM